MSTTFSGATAMQADNNASVDGPEAVASTEHQRSDEAMAVVKGNSQSGQARHVSVPQISARPRRQEMINRPSTKELIAYQQRQQHDRSNSAATVDRSKRSPVVYGGVGAAGVAATGGGGGGAFKSKLRNSFRSAAKRIRQQQSAIEALAKNSQALGLHNIRDSPRTASAQRTVVVGVSAEYRKLDQRKQVTGGSDKGHYDLRLVRGAWGLGFRYFFNMSLFT